VKNQFILTGAIFCLLLAACGEDSKTTAQKANRPGPGGDQCLIKSWSVKYQTTGKQWTRNDLTVGDQAGLDKKYNRTTGAKLVTTDKTAFAQISYGSSADRLDQLGHCLQPNGVVKPAGQTGVSNGGKDVNVRWGCYVSCKQKLEPRTKPPTRR